MRLVKTDGILGMYRGLGPPVCMMMLMNAVNFTAFGALRTFQPATPPRDGAPIAPGSTGASSPRVSP